MNMKYDALGRPVFEIIEPEIIEVRTAEPTGQEKRRERRKANRKPKLKNKKIW